MTCCKNCSVQKRWLIGIVVSLCAGAVPFAGEILTLVGIIVLTTLCVAQRIMPCSRKQDQEEQDSSSAPSTGRVNDEATASADPSSNDYRQQDEEKLGGTVIATEETIGSNPIERGTIRPRLHFLDNVKIFLTATVVTHHSACAFGGCGHKSWFLMVGMYQNEFSSFAKAFTSIDQAYFMPLFFFVSAYFVPPSYQAKGDRFLTDRARRLWIPAMLVTFVLIPICFLIGNFAGGLTPIAIPHPGQSWFLFWLLLLNWCYSTLCNSTLSPWPLSKYCEQLPCTQHRMLAGLFVCGWGMLIVVGILVSNGSFGGMPLSTGSVTCNCFTFYIGIIARRNNWLDRPLRQQLDIAIWKLWLLVIVEGAAIVYLLPKADTTPKGIGYAIAAFGVAGPFCLDTGIVVLDFFQTNLNSSNDLTRFLADAAYGVYLLHPLFIVLATSAFVWIHNAAIATTEDQYLSFRGFPAYSESHVVGGAATLALGWASVVAVSQILVWPTAWGMKQAFPTIL